MTLDGLIIDPTSRNVMDAIMDASRRQAVYSYNVANASTPGFTPVRFEDELKNATDRYGLESKDFSLEEEMSKMSMNSLKHSGLTKLLSTRMGILRKVVTMGKGG